MAKTESKPVDLYTVDPFKHDGKHFAVGDLLLGVEAELAKELTGAGRTRLATAEDVAAAKSGGAKKAAAKKDAAKKDAGEPGSSGGGEEPQT